MEEDSKRNPTGNNRLYQEQGDASLSKKLAGFSKGVDADVLRKRWCK